mmetsp:Transcript_58755/g.115336  ORF Transcript_58755/g.115336 Transcript_58755/m.115336 type:complete len:177 (+) Transcript_58755:137-667(+)
MFLICFFFSAIVFTCISLTLVPSDSERGTGLLLKQQGPHLYFPPVGPTGLIAYLQRRVEYAILGKRVILNQTFYGVAVVRRRLEAFKKECGEVLKKEPSLARCRSTSFSTKLPCPARTRSSLFAMLPPPPPPKTLLLCRPTSLSSSPSLLTRFVPLRTRPSTVELKEEVVKDATRS